jgi:hypothetical protein
VPAAHCASEPQEAGGWAQVFVVVLQISPVLQSYFVAQVGCTFNASSFESGPTLPPPMLAATRK